MNYEIHDTPFFTPIEKLKARLYRIVDKRLVMVYFVMNHKDSAKLISVYNGPNKENKLQESVKNQINIQLESIADYLNNPTCKLRMKFYHDLDNMFEHEYYHIVLITMIMTKEDLMEMMMAADREKVKVLVA